MQAHTLVIVGQAHQFVIDSSWNASTGLVLGRSSSILLLDDILELMRCALFAVSAIGKKMIEVMPGEAPRFRENPTSLPGLGR
jgi:hypothetical protein